MTVTFLKHFCFLKILRNRTFFRIANVHLKGRNHFTVSMINQFVDCAQESEKNLMMMTDRVFLEFKNLHTYTLLL